TVTAPGINCTRMNGLQSGDCLESYAAGSLVNVAATAGTGFTFDGFSGDCTGNTCSLTMNAARSVAASFGAVTFPLTVDVQGTGAGIVVSTSHPGIVCAGNAGTDGGDCSESYAANTVVTLQATPSTGSTFTGSWGGA